MQSRGFAPFSAQFIEELAGAGIRSAARGEVTRAITSRFTVAAPVRQFVQII